MAITYRKAHKVDFDTKFKPAIRPAAYYDMGAPPARQYELTARFSKKIKQR
jgi:hypothetical protein